jgi:hypothetical protein
MVSLLPNGIFKFKKWNLTYFGHSNLQKNQRPTLLQAISNLVVPTKYHGSYNEGCQKKITT